MLENTQSEGMREGNDRETEEDRVVKRGGEEEERLREETQRAAAAARHKCEIAQIM